MLVRAMLVAGQILFIAGPNAGVDNQGLMNLAAPRPGSLWAVSVADGSVLAKRELVVGPVFDGMAAVDKRLYLTTLSGQVCCFGGDD